MRIYFVCKTVSCIKILKIVYICVYLCKNYREAYKFTYIFYSEKVSFFFFKNYVEISISDRINLSFL